MILQGGNLVTSSPQGQASELQGSHRLFQESAKTLGLREVGGALVSPVYPW